MAAVNAYYNDIYFFKLDSAYDRMSTAERQQTTREGFKASWPGDSLTQSVDWNGTFHPRGVSGCL